MDTFWRVRPGCSEILRSMPDPLREVAMNDLKGNWNSRAAPADASRDFNRVVNTPEAQVIYRALRQTRT
jgi:hypothetical protein